MSSFFDSASLVQIPSGISDGTLYSVKPIDGSGDLTFSRGSDIEATRVNANGYIEKAQVNLLLQSNTFSTTWNLVGVTATGGQAGYDGTNDAWEITKDSGVFRQINQTISYSGVYTFSFYAKGTTAIRWRGGNNDYLYQFDLSTGTATSHGVYDAIEKGMVSVGGGWYRCYGTANFSARTSYEIYADWNDPTILSFYLQDAQLNYGLVAQTYQETTTAAVVSGITNDMPRLNYDPANPTCPSLLLEGSRTNTATNSEYFGGYTAASATVVSNQATSPEGVQNATLLYPSTSGNFAGRYLTLAPSTTGVVSCFVKQAGKRYAIIGTDNNGTYTCIFDLQTASVVYEATNYTGKIEAYSNGWYRISAAYTSSTAANYPFIGVADGSNGAVTADGTNGIYIYGFQYETAVSYGSSYIPTYGTSATRTADAAYKTGISSLIGQTEGTLFIEGTYQATNTQYTRFIALKGSGTTYQNVLLFQDLQSGEFNLGINDASASSVCSITFTHGLSDGDTYKIAIAYATNDIVVYMNGTSRGTDTSYTPIAFSDMRLQYTDIEGLTINKQALLFKTRLSNADLATLTA